MIIWGWKTVFRVIGSGVFSCPTCGTDRNYERRKAQRFFTLFFIPLIPLKTVGEFVRCTYCKNDFRDSVLARPTASQFTDLLQNTVRGVMVNVLRRGGWEHPGARAIAVQEIVTAGAVGYGEQNLAQDMQVVPADLTQMLASLAGQLPDAGREALVAGATRVAAADGPVQPAERAVIDSVGAALGMSQAYVAGIVAAVPAAVAPAQAPAWGTGAQVPPQAQAPAQAPAWGTAAQVPPQAPAGAGMETMMIQAPQPPSATGAQDAVPPQAPASGMETMLIQAPQPAPVTGSHGAVPPQTPPPAGGSGMETMLIQAPQPAPVTGSHGAVPPQTPPPAGGSGMETMLIPAPQPAPATGSYGAVPVPVPVPPQQDTVPEPPPTRVEPPANAMETMVIPVPPQQPTIPAPPPTMVDNSSSMETMVVPLPRPVDPVDEPTHVTRADDPGPAGGWPPPRQEQ
ncbi:tellurite resistance protein [Catenulispora sp. MAP12-49]|uniref:zinc-ribbon domain-containing protein n=1 Tax=Catenulispora sp. MAP12-49 TaxID=3156302 RepID=UPI003519B4B3